MQTREQLTSKVDDAARDIEDKFNRLEHHAGEIKNEIQQAFTLGHQAKNRPWAYVAASFAAGFGIGLIVR